MDLTLSVISYRGERPTEPVEITLHGQSGTVGRKPHNDLVLPDPERVVSSTHVRIEYQGGQYFLLDQSTNGTYLNHAPDPVPQGRPIALSDGDVLTVGDYELRVTLHPGAADEAEREWDSPPPAAVQAPIQPPMEGGSAAALDPLAMLERSSTAGQHASAPSALAAEPKASIPDDLDLLEGLTPPPAPGPTQPGDRGSPEQVAYTPPSPVAERPSVGAEPSAPPQPAPPPAPVPSATPPSETPGFGPALLEALGLESRPLTGEEAERLARLVGRLLHVSVEGLMRVLASRAEFKREMRLEMTTIRPVENNPLKFSVDATEALERMLFEHRPGFLEPVEALQEAMDDILAHELAMLAGMRAALQAILDRLDPKTLEARLDRHASLAGILPPLRRARYWGIFKESYDEVRRDAEEGFMQLFGETFVKAYEAQVRQLKTR